VSNEEFDWRLARIEEIKKDLCAWHRRVSCPRIRELGASIIRKRLARVVRPLVAEKAAKE
jgi:hypothetical protein